MKYLILAGLFVIAASCSSSDKPAVFDDSSNAGSHAGGTSGASGHAGTAGTAGKAQGGGSNEGGEAGVPGGGGGDSVSPLAPQISITNPVATTDPNVGPVISGDQITVLCSAKASDLSGAKPVNPASVKIAMLDATGTSLKSVAGSPTSNTDEYSAPFVLTSLSSGRVSFQCSADDTATQPNHASVTLDTLFDLGPTITVVTPVKDSPHSLLGPVDVQFTVTPSLVTPDDKQADVDVVTLHVGGVTIPVTAKTGGQYQAAVDFSDKTLFPSPPTGATAVVIAASNKRTAPGSITHTVAYTFILDGVGPTVAFTAPAEGAVIGRASILSFTILDSGSGVDTSSLSLTINNDTYPFSTTDGLWTASDTTGAYTFKAGARLGTDSTVTQATINVNVRDKAGNASNGNSRGFKLDTQPPIVDLDPPNMYLTRPGSAPQTTQCSDSFDPVGSGAPSDLSTVTNFGRLRALVWDQTNHKIGQDIFTYALIDKSSVRLYVQPDTTKPLLHHESAPDNVCDEIWTGSAPEQKNPDDKPLQFIALTSLAATGVATWGVNPPPDSICGAGLTSTASRLCNGFSDMTLIIHHPVVIPPPREPVVYAYQPSADPSDGKCAGDQWDFGGTPKLGWVCVAARAVDTVGNPGVSAPIRVCIDDGTNPDRCKDVPPPSCTDNCTPPPHFAVPAASQN